MSDDVVGAHDRDTHAWRYGEVVPRRPPTPIDRKRVESERRALFFGTPNVAVSSPHRLGSAILRTCERLLSDRL